MPRLIPRKIDNMSLPVFKKYVSHWIRYDCEKNKNRISINVKYFLY
jgi:hypothetical protein